MPLKVCGLLCKEPMRPHFFLYYLFYVPTLDPESKGQLSVDNASLRNFLFLMARGYFFTENLTLKA